MPDEDSTLVTQTQQSSTTQPWDDDFVLDFWDGDETEKKETSNDFVEDEKEEIENIDENILDSTDESTDTENNTESWESDIKTETSDSDESDEDFNISFDTESVLEPEESESDAEVKEEKENIETEKTDWNSAENSDSDLFGDNDLFDSKESVEIEEKQDNLDSEEVVSDNVDNSNEIIDSIVSDTTTEDAVPMDDEVSAPLEQPVADDNEQPVAENNEEPVAEDNEQPVVENNEEPVAENSQDNGENNIEDSNESMKQPEISDLLWDKPIDFSANDSADSNNNTEWNVSEINSSANNLDDSSNDENLSAQVEDTPLNTTEETKVESELSQPTTDSENKNVLLEDSTENTQVEQNTTELNVQDNKPENVEENTNPIGRTPDMVNNSQQNPEINTDNAPAGVEIKQTLSLDEILDSELTNNPQFSDKSKAVPNNVPTHSGLFGNKMAIFAWIWLFVLIWFVAFLAFPSGNSERKPGDIAEYTWDIVDMNDSHSVSPDLTGEIDNPTQWDGQETWNKANTGEVHGVPTSIIFPDAWNEWYMWDELGTWDVWGETPEIQPFTWSAGEDITEITPEIVKISAEEAESKISSFKLQGEQYYTLGEQLQDKQMMKFARQVIYLCDNYQAKIGSWEWLDQDSFTEFKTNVNSIISNMQDIAGWSDDAEEFIQSNFREEYDFTGKDGVKDFIYRTN